ncbi:MAG: two-component system sensor histidine kinase NtrB [Candidatus Binataceae bacterium]
MRNDFNPSSKSLLGSPFRIAALYFAAGILWLGFANLILEQLPPHSIGVNRFVFTCVTGVILYLVASRYSRRLHETVRAEREAASRARAFFESAVEGIVQLNSDGSIRQMNPRALEMFGYKDAEVVGQPVELLVPSRLRDRHAGHREAFFAAPRSRRMGAGMEIIGARKDGTEFTAEVSLSHIVFENTNRVVAFVSDISARRVMEREARRNETLHALGAVAAAIAHELNNPLAVISSRIELMLAASNNLPSETRDDLCVLQRNVERASRISRNLLALARQRPPSRAPVDINGSIEEIVALVFGEARIGAARVELALDRTIPRVMGDQTGLEQVMVNLLMNARDAAADRIKIETGADPSRAGWIRIVVSDNGSGAPAEVIARIFEPFYTTKEHGTGLGLWLSHRVIIDHGGTIEPQSEPGRGMSFVIRLPGIGVRPEQTAASTPPIG